MNTIKIIPALVLLTLSLNAKPNNEADQKWPFHSKTKSTNTNVKTVKNKMTCPAELLTEKNKASVRLSFTVNESGKAENVIINADDEKVKQFVNEKISNLSFPQKNEEVNMVIHFKLG